MKKDNKDLPNKKQKDEDEKIEIGEEDEDIYKPLGRKHLLENDEIDEKEEGIMEGYDKAGDWKRNTVKGKKDTEFETMIKEEETFEKEVGIDINKDLKNPILKKPIAKSKPMKKSSIKSKRK